MWKKEGKLRHKKFGEGISNGRKGSSIVADFPEIGVREYDPIISIANGIIEPVDFPEFSQRMENLQDLLNNASRIRGWYQTCSREIEPYREELE